MVDKRAKQSGFQDFSYEPLSATDVEIRLWATGGFVKLRGIILQKRGPEWKSYSLPAATTEDGTPHLSDLSGQFADWDQLEKKLADYRFDNGGSYGFAKQKRYQDGQGVLLQFRRGNEPEMILSSTEPCAQDDEIGARLCSITKDVQSHLGIPIMMVSNE